MPVEHAIWRLGDTPQKLDVWKLDNEKDLEDLISQDISILNDKWLLIGRQVHTTYNKTIDLLAIDASGSLIIIELKKNKTPREVVAQAIDYATWIKELDASKIADVFEKFSETYLHKSVSLDQYFADRFKTQLDEDDLNSSHQMVIVAAELDSSTERIVNYLNEFNIPLNILFFRVFQDGETRYLSRSWFIDPAETQKHATTPVSTEPWNGEFYVSFGHGFERSWEDASRYGFISAGGGRWYTQTLNQLERGNRVWVYVPQTGYVGIGLVTTSAVKVDEFMVETEEGMRSLLEADIKGDYFRATVGDEDNAEYVAGVEWIRKVDITEAKTEVGFFANQNTVAKPRSHKWIHTVERLRILFQYDEEHKK